MKHLLLWAIPFVGLVLAPVAHADIWTDVQFVNDVNKTGIPYDSRASLIDMGHALCDALHSGNIEYDQAVNGMSTHGGGNIATSNALASLAVSRICPDEWYQVVTSQPAFAPGARIKV